MKRTIRTILCAAAVILAAVSCQKFNLEEGRKGTIDIRIGGLMGEYAQTDGTKSSLVNTIRVSWEQGDVIYVFDGTRCLGSLVASLDGTEDRIALLSTDAEHTVEAPAEGTTQLTLIHSPLLTEAPSVSEGVVSISLANQSSEKAPFVAYATMDYNNETSIENAVVPFHFATSIIKVNCTGLKANTAINSASLNNVNTACQLSLSGTAAPTIDGGVKGSITRTGDAYFAASKINAEGEAVFQIAVPKLGADNARYLIIKQGSDFYNIDKNFTNKSLNPATSVNTVCQTVVYPTGILPGEFSVSDDNGAHITKIYFSQGNLWYGPATTGAASTFNFEANQYDKGAWTSKHISYFFWSASSDKAVMDGVFSDPSASADDVLFTNKSGFTVVVDEHNQAGWRTLSSNEWQYLLNTRKLKDDKAGYTLGITYLGKLGTVIYPDDYDQEPVSDMVTELPAGVVFLPATGFYSFNSTLEQYRIGSESWGTYWTSTRGTSATKASFLLLNSSSILIKANQTRAYAMPIRLVKDIQ